MYTCFSNFKSTITLLVIVLLVHGLVKDDAHGRHERCVDARRDCDVVLEGSALHQPHRVFGSSSTLLSPISPSRPLLGLVYLASSSSHPPPRVLFPSLSHLPPCACPASTAYAPPPATYSLLVRDHVRRGDNLAANVRQARAVTELNVGRDAVHVAIEDEGLLLLGFVNPRCGELGAGCGLVRAVSRVSGDRKLHPSALPVSLPPSPRWIILGIPPRLICAMSLSCTSLIPRSCSRPR